MVGNPKMYLFWLYIINHYCGVQVENIVAYILYKKGGMLLYYIYTNNVIIHLLCKFSSETQLL